MSRIGIAGLQLDLPRGDNLDRFDREIDSVRKRFPWVHLVVIGELGVFGPDPALAQPLPGPAEARFCEAARRNGFWLVPGSLFERAGDCVYNTAPVIDPAGRVVARYRKMFPFFPYERGVTPGSDFVVFDIPGVARIGVSICYDMWFPETIRTLAWMGAEVILHPTMTPTQDRELELVLSRAHAITNQVYFVDVNGVGPWGGGRSLVVDPEGTVLHQAGEGETFFAVRIDVERVRSVRESGTFGLVQSWKQLRDTGMRFPPYQEGGERGPVFDGLGPLKLPTDVR